MLGSPKLGLFLGGFYLVIIALFYLFSLLLVCSLFYTLAYGYCSSVNLGLLFTF